MAIQIRPSAADRSLLTSRGFVESEFFTPRGKRTYPGLRVSQIITSQNSISAVCNDSERVEGKKIHQAKTDLGQARIDRLANESLKVTCSGDRGTKKIYKSDSGMYDILGGTASKGTPVRRFRDPLPG